MKSAKETVERAKERLSEHNRGGLKECDWNSTIFNQGRDMLERHVEEAEKQLEEASTNTPG